MKKPKLKDYSNEILILLSKQYKDDEFDNEAAKVMEERYMMDSYINLYLKYKKAKSRVEKKALANALAGCLEENLFFVENDVFDEMIPDLSIEHLWNLGKSENKMIREKSRTVIFELLDEIDEKIKMEEKQEKKKNKVKIIKFKKEGR